MPSLRDEYRANLIRRIKWIRLKADQEIEGLVDTFLTNWHKQSSEMRVFAERGSIECDTWSERKLRACYNQDALKRAQDVLKALDGPD